LPRAVGEITYRFRVTPHDDRQSFTEARDAFVRSVSHGKRQTLGFITDAGDYRVVQAKILRKPLQVDINAPFWADFEVAWEVTDPILAAPNPPGVVTWGPQQHWAPRRTAAAISSTAPRSSSAAWKRGWRSASSARSARARAR
jgi:hypothetical protein